MVVLLVADYSLGLVKLDLVTSAFEPLKIPADAKTKGIDGLVALADGSFGRDGVFHAKALQAKCASKYAPQQPGAPTNGTPSSAPPKSVTQVQRPSVTSN